MRDKFKNLQFKEYIPESRDSEEQTMVFVAHSD